MNKYILTLITVSLIAFQSCKEAETTEPDNEKVSIEGVWNFDGMDMKNGVISIDNTPFATFNSTSSNEQGTFDFGANGKVTSNIAYTNTTVSTFLGQSETETEDIPMTSSTQDYTYDEANGIITIVDPDEGNMAYTITELTSSKLVMKYAFSYEEDDQGTLFGMEADLLLELSR
jgi:prenyltransferase beta subunit